jgi:hypothetical protein
MFFAERGQRRPPHSTGPVEKTGRQCFIDTIFDELEQAQGVEVQIVHCASNGWVWDRPGVLLLAKGPVWLTCVVALAM